ncbi:Gfo/Idh/MocA family oxidoreductase [Rhodocaloribacter litoris]|uniref:Gfo/Idh/MocA family protein n=1 Tax=Rhodocaloribacter litoris TaxID=2558931 RepID=UPI0014229B3E|nr:Gfo/Idh/MocA family oxidoreductase [Rhodocaloribacter litoris]QXD14646.1 Gfo/Idh/MocA family oxidoreductase [Rhodocaloribacter litoris]
MPEAPRTSVARKLRWGLLGTARINRSLIPPLRLSPRNEPVAVASRDAERAAAFARTWDLPKAYGSYEDLLADPDIDVVYVPLPNHLHVPWTLRAVAAGKHVLCEKPMALTPADVDAVARAADEAGVVVAEAFMYRHHPRTRRIRELIAGGALGELHLVRGAFTFVLDRPNDVRWRPEWGGGSLWDLGCYPVSFTRHVVGAEPEAVFAWQVLGPTGVDVSFTGQMRFPGDVLAVFDCGFRSRFRMEMAFVGRDGLLEAPRAFKPRPEEPMRRYGPDVDVPEPVLVDDPDDLYLGEVEDLAAAVLDGRPPEVTLAETRANTVVLEALLRSARTGRPVRLS